MPRKIAMIGTASSGVHGPFKNTDFAIWGVSARASYVTRADRWFELHNLSSEPPEWANSWRAEMRKFTQDIGEVLMLYPEPDLAPKVTPYPHQSICDRFGTFFMTSTFSWMMALAINEMAPVGQMAESGSEIAIFGVDMEHGTEYEQQRAGFRHFISLAQALGIEVTRLASGGLVYEPIPYPLWQDDPLMSKITSRQETARDNLTNYNGSLAMVQTQMACAQAVLMEIEKAGVDGYSREESAAALAKHLATLTEASMRISKDIVFWEGAETELRFLKGYLSP